MKLSEDKNNIFKLKEGLFESQKHVPESLKCDVYDYIYRDALTKILEAEMALTKLNKWVKSDTELEIVNR